MIGKNGGNFLTAHYDWIAAAVAVAALAAGVVLFVGSLGADADELAAARANAVKNMSPGGEPVKAADMTDFKLATSLAKSPKKIDGEVTDDKGSFLASERRVFCEKCQAVVPADLTACPSCGFERKQEEKAVVDADGDGLPDSWEKRYGLNPNDPADAALDKDMDGFSNAEEFEAKTDPTDRNDHPDYLDSLAIQLPLKETVLPFYFTGTLKTPSGLKFKFKDPSRAKEYDRGIYSVLAGEEIGKSGFVPKELVTKSEDRKMGGGGMTKKVDVSEAIVARKSDGKTVAMQVNRKGVPFDVQAKLVYKRDGKSFDVVAGDTIELNGTKYVVKSIKKTAKGATVAVEHATLGKIRELSALEP